MNKICLHCGGTATAFSPTFYTCPCGLDPLKISFKDIRLEGAPMSFSGIDRTTDPMRYQGIKSKPINYAEAYRKLCESQDLELKARKITALNKTIADAQDLMSKPRIFVSRGPLTFGDPA